MDAFYHAASQLPGAVSQALMRIPPRWAGDITEIRLRSGRPVSLSTPSGARFVSIDGGWREKPDTGVLSTPHALVQNCFQAICGYSVHSFADCIANGFVPLPGGHRAGVCGTAFVDGSGTFTLKNITSINLRVARTGLCACDAVLRPLLCAPGVGLLIAGAPGSGKTTLLNILDAASRRAGGAFRGGPKNSRSGRAFRNRPCGAVRLLHAAASALRRAFGIPQTHRYAACAARTCTGRYRV